MKKINVKKWLITTLSFAMISVAVSGISLLSSVSTAKANETSNTIEQFEMQDIGTIRSSSNNAIRFSTLVNKTWLEEEMKTKTVEIGTLIIPQFVLTNEELTTSDTDFKVGTAGARHYQHTEDKWLEVGDYYKMNAVLEDIPAADLATNIVAKSYVKIGDSITYSAPVIRSIGEVASKIIGGGVQDTTIQTIAQSTITGITLEGENTTIALPEGQSKSLTVTPTFAEGLREQPDLEKYGLAWTNENAEILTLENGAITSTQYTGETSTVFVKVAGYTKSIAVKPTLPETNNGLETNFYKKDDGEYFAYGNGGGADAPKVNNEVAYVKEGISSLEWYFSGGERGSMLYLNKYEDGTQAYNINDIFLHKTDDSSISFDVYNGYSKNLSYALWYARNYDVTPDGTLTAGDWTTVTITKAKFEEIVNNSSNTNGNLYFFVFADAKVKYSIYFDNFQINTTAKENAGDIGLEENFFKLNDTAYLTIGNGGGANNPVVNEKMKYVKEGELSWRWTFSGDKGSMLKFSIGAAGEQAYNIDDIFYGMTDDSSISFDVYNAYSAALNYKWFKYGRDYNVTLDGTLKAKDWTTITLTKEKYDEVIAAYDGTLSFFVYKTDATTTTKLETDLYFDNFKVNVTEKTTFTLEEKFADKRIEGGSESLICFTYNPGTEMTINTTDAYIKEGSSSWKWTLQKNNSLYGAMLKFSIGQGKEYNIDTILADETVTSVTFEIKNTGAKDLYYYFGNSRPSNDKTKATGTLTKGNWVTITITKEILDSIVTGSNKTFYLNIFTDSANGVEANYDMYFDNMQINRNN